MIKESRSLLRRFPTDLKLVLATIMLGLVSGLVGIVLNYLLELVEILAFGQTEHQTAFLTDGVSDSRIGYSLLVVGLSSAVVWYFLQRKVKIFSIKGQLEIGKDGSPPKIHIWKQLFHSLWQIIAVGGGAPIGKEGAPREIGALFARPIGKIFCLPIEERLFLIACGAGAGLAAVYQVPLTSIFFVFETLGLAFSVKRFVLVGLTTYLSANIAGFVISNHALYQMPVLTWSLQEMRLLPLLVLTVVPLAWFFGTMMKQATIHRIKNKWILFSLPLSFLLVAGLALYYPHLLGNGRMMAQDLPNGSDARTVLLLFVFKAFVVLITLWAGAYGGTLTPSFSLGMAGAALLSFTFGVENPTTLLLLGSVCFLTVTLRAPLSATGLVVGFTGLTLESLPYLLVTAYAAYGFAKTLDALWQNVKTSKNSS